MTVILRWPRSGPRRMRPGALGRRPSEIGLARFRTSTFSKSAIADLVGSLRSHPQGDGERLTRRVTAFVAALVFFLVFGHRRRIDAGKPAVEVDVGAAPRAERAECRDNGLAADRALAALKVTHERNMGRKPSGANLVCSSWLGIAVRRTASLRSPMSRPSTTLAELELKDVDARDERAHDDRGYAPACIRPRYAGGGVAYSALSQPKWIG